MMINHSFARMKSLEKDLARFSSLADHLMKYKKIEQMKNLTDKTDKLEKEKSEKLQKF